jgi:phenylacetate-coenzyme A ligase PaaK-like adenylate-forming protein
MLASITTTAQRWAVSQVMARGLKDRLDLLARRKNLYARVADPSLIAHHQLVAFNAIWESARRRYRFYADWQRRHRLPDRLDDLAELAAFPLLRSSDIEENFATISADAQPCQLVRTGGSTGRPRYFPRGPEDHPLHHASMYLGRSWAGISPGDEIALIWSHTHLFGHGLKGRVNVARRHMKDWLIGTRRFSAYSLDDESMASYFQAMRARPGTVVVGYASCIRKLLDYVETSGIDGAAARIRAAIFCSETVFPKDLERVRRVLGAEPLIEYGMQETGVMAYSRPGTGDVTFFWDAFHAHMGPNQELVATTLLPVRFPLINFATGDRIEPLAGGDGPPFRCARILGRTRDVITLSMRDGKTIDAHSDFIFDILQIDDGVLSFFIHQKGRKIDIAVVAPTHEDLQRIERRLLHEIAREFPAIDTSAISFSFLEEEPRTIAGKRRYLLRD